MSLISGTGTLDLIAVQNSTVGPSNDFCYQARYIGCNQTIFGYTQGASIDNTISPGNNTPIPICDNQSSNGIGVWFLTQGNGQVFTFSTCSFSTFDTKISVYQGTSCNNLICVAENDNACGGTRSSVSFLSNPGVRYYVLVHGPPNTVGLFRISLNCSSPNVPANDLCNNATPIGCGETIAGTTTSGATVENVPCAGNSQTPGVWYRFTAGYGTATLSLCNFANFNTYLSVYRTTNCTNFSCVGANDNACGNKSEVTINTVPGEYYVLVRGVGQIGNFELSLNCAFAPVNDLCTNATRIECGETITGTTLEATSENVSCASSLYSGVWYKFTGDYGTATLSLCNSANFNTFLAVYLNVSGSCSVLTCVGFNDNACGTSSEITINTIPIEYFVLVQGVFEEGDFELSLTCMPPPPSNDECANAEVLTCGQTFSGAVEGATATGAPQDCLSGGSLQDGVWFTFTGTGTGTLISVVTQLPGTDLSKRLHLYNGTCEVLSCTPNVDYTTNGTIFGLFFTSVLNEGYYLYLDGAGGATGNYEISLDCIFPCSVSIGSVSTVDLPCMAGSLTIDAACNNCNSLEYAINGGAFQTTNSFTSLDAGIYNIVVRDNQDPSCMATAQVQIENAGDMASPEINCPSGFSKINDTGYCGAFLNNLQSTATDNCGIASLQARFREVGTNDWSAYFNDPNGYYAVGEYELEWLAIDQVGNEKTCSITFEITDEQAPAAECILNNTIPLYYGQTITLQSSNVLQPGYSDNCSGMLDFTITPSQLNYADHLNTTLPVSVTVEDPAGNVFNCTSNITVTSAVNPCNLVLDGIDLTEASCSNTNDGAMVLNVSCYSCSILMYSIDNGANFQSSNTFINLTAGEYPVVIQDNYQPFCGLIQNVVVGIALDEEDPFADCKNKTIGLETGQSYTLQPTDVLQNFGDNCTNDISISINPPIVSDSDIGSTLEVTVAVTDATGNSTDCISYISVVEPQPCNDLPMIVAQSGFSVPLDENCQYLLTPSFVLDGDGGCTTQADFEIHVLDDDPSNGPVVDGCGVFTYTIDLVTPYIGVSFSGGGSFTAEDNIPVDMLCPSSTDKVKINKAVHRYNEEFLMSDDSFDPASTGICWGNIFDPASGNRYYDLLTFTVTTDDLYFLEMTRQMGTPGAGALFEGDFNLASPCDNLIALTQDIEPGTGYNFGNAGSADIVGIAAPLKAGQTYTMLSSTRFVDQTDFYQWGFYSLGGGELVGFPPSPRRIQLPLYCDDIQLMVLETTETYIIDWEGLNYVVPPSPELEAQFGYVYFVELLGNCGDIFVSVSDQLNPAMECEPDVIERTFTVTGQYNTSCTPASVNSCTQEISSRKPTFADIRPPLLRVFLDANDGYAPDPTETNSIYPAPSVSGTPFIVTPFEVLILEQFACTIGVSYNNGVLFEVGGSDGTVKFVRTWNITDFCDEGTSMVSFQQTIFIANAIPAMEMAISPGEVGPDEYEVESLFNSSSNSNLQTLNSLTETPVEAINDLEVYPNPVTKDAFNGILFSLEEAKIQLKVFNFQGQLIESLTMKLVTGRNKFRLDVSNWPPGVYWLGTEVKRTFLRKRVVVQ